MNNWKEYHDFAVELAYECGEIARRHAKFDIVASPKSDDSPVTIADIEINRHVIERCRERYPEIGVLGEEESSGGDGGRLLWVCDPIDGTMPYIFGVSASTFCLALVEEGVPRVGVVYDFMNDRLFHAIHGKGAYLGDDRITAPAYPPLKIVEFEWWPTAIMQQGFHERAIAAKWQVVNYASFGYMGTQVALGRISGAIYSGQHPWDVAALKVIAEESGCRVTNLKDADQRYDQPIYGAIIARSEFHAELYDYVKESIGGRGEYS
jgi:myo-inositol-1(or 4)-monophosphatase